jgi:hypothetical protein
MINVVLDTNILHEEGLSSRKMQLLQRLIEANHIELFIPEIVMREYVTKKTYDSLKELQDAHVKLESLKKNMARGSDLYLKVDDAQEIMLSIRDGLETKIWADFDKWIIDFSVSILPFKTECMKEVIDNYFTGGGVYRKPKHRDDIPDAIINSSITELLADKKSLTVLIKDGVFKTHLSSINNVTVFDSLPSFLELDINRHKIDELDKLTARTEEVKIYLRSESFTSDLLNYLSTSKNIIEYIYLEGPAVTAKNKFIKETFGERINSPKAENINNLHLCNPEHLGGDDYSVEVIFTTLASLTFCTDYFYYMECENESSLTIDSMNGDGVCDIGVEDYFTFNGFIEIHIPENLNQQEIEHYVQTLASVDNPISLDLTIESVNDHMQ